MDAARRSLLVTAHFLCPLLFFTNLTRNPYITQIALLNAALALALAAWAWREAARAEGARLPRLPVEWPLAAFVLVWAASWLRGYLGHVPFLRPAMAAEGARVGLFLFLNALAAFWLGATTAADDEDGGEVALGPWIVFVLLWALLWSAFPQARQRLGGRADDLFVQIWDPYGASLWAGGLGAALWLCRRGRLADFLHLAFATGFLASLYGVGQYFNIEVVWPNVLNPYGGRAVSTFGNPNFLSTYNAALMPSAAALFLVARSGPRRWAYGALFLTLEAALLATLTRSSWAGAAVGVAALALSPRLRGCLSAAPRSVGLLAFLAVALALGWPASTISAGYTPSFIGRLTEAREILARDGFYSPLHQRVLIWTSAWLMGSEAPALGKGGGLFELFYPFYQGTMLHAEPFFHTMRTHANNAHNELLETFAQTGLLGLGVYLWLWAAFFAAARRWAREQPDLNPAWAGAVAGTAGVLVDNLLNVSLHFAVPAFIFWWLAGAAMGRGARAGPPPRIWAAGAFARRAAAAALAAICLLACWWQLRFWAREAWYFAGFKLVRQGQLSAAVRALERSRSWGPREVNAIYELGNAYARAGRTTEAAAAYEAALAANAGYDEIYFNLATLYATQLGRPDKAGPNYEMAWALNPLSNDALNGLVAHYLRDPAKNRAALQDVLAEARRNFPGNPNHWNNHGYLLTLEKRWSEAEAAYERALQIAPELVIAERNLAGIAVQSGRPPSGLLADLRELRALGAAAAAGDRSPAALARAQRLAARRPELLHARFLHGSLLLAVGRPGEAAVELEWVARRDRVRAAPRLNLGDAYLALGRRQDARLQYQAVLAIEAGNTVARARLDALGSGP